MRVPVDRIGPDGLDLDEAISVQWLNNTLGSDSPYRTVRAGHLRVHLSRVEQAVHVLGRLAAGLEATCSRCLGHVDLDMNSAIDVTLFPSGEEPSASADGELDAEDLGVGTYDDQEIDLAAVVHDEVLLELPPYPVCRAECAGLCPKCGEDLNHGPCACGPQIDPRLQALAHIKVSNTPRE